MTCLSLLVVSLAIQSPGADSLLRLATGPSESALIVESRERPTEVREAVAEGMARAVRRPAAAPAELAAVRRLAVAYAIVWQDSFYLREVERFAGWPENRRAVKVRADSVRRAGIAAYGRDGPLAAVAIWQQARRSSIAIGDSAGAAAVMGNIGAAFLVEGVLDSATGYLERARTMAGAIGDARVEANAVGLLAGVHEERGELEAARESYARAMALRARTGDRRGLAADHNNLGLLARRLGDQAEARRHFESALDINRRDGRDAVAATNLLNLAGIASEDGDFTRAEAFYRDALATWRAEVAWPDVASALLALGELELRRGDYPAARQFLVEAQGIYDRTGPVIEAITVRRKLAEALAAAGDLQAALEALRRAQALADSARVAPDVRGGLLLSRADFAVRLNDFAEADRWYAEAEALYRVAGDLSGQAEAQSGRGRLMIERAEYVQAQSLLASAMRSQRAIGNERSAAVTRLLLADAYRQSGDRSGAGNQLTQAVTEFLQVGDSVGAAAALDGLGDLALEAGRLLAADSLYRAGLSLLDGYTAPDVGWRLHAGLGRTAAARGAPDEAVRELRAAIAELEGPALTLQGADRRSGYFTDKWEVYGQLALVERSRNRTASAFEVSERLRASELRASLAAGRVGAPTDSAAALLATAQDLRRRMAELVREQQAPLSQPIALRGPGSTAGGGQQREALARAQEAYAELLREMSDMAPAQADLLSGDVLSWRDVARRLSRGEVLVEYLVVDSTSIAFVVTPDTLGVVDLGIGRRDLASLVEFTRGALERPGAPGVDSLWRSPLRRLHEYLIAPVEASGLLAGARRLILVPHLELHYLPFAALLDPASRRYLVQRYELVETPSASIWVALGARSRVGGSGGVMAFAPRPEALPASLAEVQGIGQLAGSSTTVLTGPAASESAFRRAAPSSRVLHLATYGVLNKENPLFSYVDLGPDAAHDGRLDVHEVFGLQLSADLVVLSACQTGLGSGVLADVPAGDDWVGLTRAFLQAGAGSVVASLWSVEDRATAVLMERMYGSMAAGAVPAAALAQAQRSMLQSNATAHPFQWAGFVAVGGRR